MSDADRYRAALVRIARLPVGVDPVDALRWRYFGRDVARRVLAGLDGPPRQPEETEEEAA